MRVSIICILCLCSFVAYPQIVSNSSGSWNNTTTWVGGIVPGYEDDIEIIGGHEISLTANASVQDILLTDGSIVIGEHTFTIYGDVSGDAANNIYSSSLSQLILRDKGDAQIFTFPLHITSLQKLEMNRAAGARVSHNLRLDQNVPADGVVLVLTNGILNMLAGSKLLLNSHDVEVDISCSDNSYVDGIVQRNIKRDTGFNSFPVGNGGFCRPFGISITSGGASAENLNEVQFVYDTPINNESVDFSKLPGGIYQYYFWRHDVSSGSNTQRRIYYQDEDFPGLSSVNRIAALALSNTDGTSAWTRPTTPRTVDDVNKWVTFDNSNASNDRYWTFGSIQAEVPIDGFELPIELIRFDAEVRDNAVLLTWVTGSEINNDFFTVERSQEGIDFYPVIYVPGAGNSNQTLEYQYVDDAPFHGLSYYRLKQTDYNADFSYSAIVEVMLLQSAHIRLNRKNASILECRILAFAPDEIIVYLLQFDGKIIAQYNDIVLPEQETVIELDISRLETPNAIIFVKTNSLSQKIKYIANER